MIMHVLLSVLLHSAAQGSVSQEPRVPYTVTELQTWANQLTKLHDVPQVSVELSSEPIFLSVAIPGKLLLDTAYFPHRMTSEEAKAALAREVSNLGVVKNANKADLVQLPRLFGWKPSFSSYGMLSMHGRTRAMDDSLSLLTKIGGKPVAMLTLHEIEAQEIAHHLPMIEGILMGKWTDLMANIRKKVSQLDDAPRRSAVSNFYRVRTVILETKAAFWFRDIKLFELLSKEASLVSETSSDLNAFLDSAPQPLEIKVNGGVLLLGKLRLELDDETASVAGRRQVIKAITLWRQMAGS